MRLGLARVAVDQGPLHLADPARAFLLIIGIALIPGYLNVQLVTSLLLDHPAPIDFDFDYPALTLLVAVYNEEVDVAQTVAYALEQEYPAPLNVIVIDDGSTDETVQHRAGLRASG